MHDEQGFLRWQQARHQELAGPDSWLGLIGLVWLEAGSHGVGRGEDCVVHLPTGPMSAGQLEVAAEGIFWCPQAGVESNVDGGEPAGAGRWRLVTDQFGQPSQVEVGRYTFFLIEREGRLAARLRDRAWAEARPFAGLDYYPWNPACLVEADWQPLAPPQTMEVPDVTGQLKTVEVVWQAVFHLEGQALKLLPVSVGAGEAFFVFRDRTSGRETYGAGRFLKGRLLGGKMALDFNRAYNPPCAFTPFATCPLPPPENWLPIALPAGEKKPPAGLSGH